MASKFKGIKTAAEYKRGELARDILRLVGAGVMLGSAVVAPNIVQVLDMFNPKGRQQRNKIWKAIKYLEDQERISIREEDGERIVKLTRKGEVALTDMAMDELSINQPSWWDRKWRVVMFDIPAYMVRTRSPFREKILDLGFEMYQKSVFVYPYECRKEVMAVAEFYGMRDHIRYMTVEEMSHMREFVRKFDLL